MSFLSVPLIDGGVDESLTCYAAILKKATWNLNAIIIIIITTFQIGKKTTLVYFHNQG